MTQGLSSTIRRFKRAAWQLRHLAEEPDLDLSLKYEMRQTGDGASGSFDPGGSVHRMAALLRPFMAPGSEIELRSVWGQLRDLDGLDEESRRGVDAAFADADQLPFLVAVNDRQLTARDVYYAYGEGLYFGDDADAKELLDEMSVGPFATFIPMLFHEACAAYAGVVFALLDVVLARERLDATAFRTKAPAGPCIYCRSEHGPFRTEEHVIPESLGTDELVLVGAVCDACNNRLSVLDEALLNFEPLAFLRTVYTPLTKQGRFPRTKLQGVEIAKVAPREIRITQKAGARNPVRIVDENEGVVRFTIAVAGRRRADPTVLARALFKIGLGLVAAQAGLAAALDARYDAARTFVNDAAAFGTHLLLPATVTPGPQLRTWWLPAEGSTPVVISLFGLVFAFNLGPVPASLPNVPAGSILSFWLGAPGADPLDNG